MVILFFPDVTQPYTKAIGALCMQPTTWPTILRWSALVMWHFKLRQSSFDWLAICDSATGQRYRPLGFGFIRIYSTVESGNLLAGMQSPSDLRGCMVFYSSKPRTSFPIPYHVLQTLYVLSRLLAIAQSTFLSWQTLRDVRVYYDIGRPSKNLKPWNLPLQTWYR